MCNMPMTIIEHPVFCSVSRFDVRVKRSTIAESMPYLFEMVENRIAHKMANTVGAVKFDGWSNSSTHYVAFDALYCTTHHVQKHDEKQDHCITRSTLLGVSPMGQIESECDDIEAETTCFNEEVHLSFFKDCFEFCRIRFSYWCLCFVATMQVPICVSLNWRVSRMWDTIRTSLTLR